MSPYLGMERSGDGGIPQLRDRSAVNKRSEHRINLACVEA